ncbi:hypothetical protein CC78DRAFT_528308 [Lojkania enalia]|uniref:Uncharacterized protein n=1 Tax=Lojkania enalia TaxID=147567 RepID=A0A9P4NCC5_9PLEO|nr:hypothetical protein CC78DRAFT_528308 [Didymosphaeria enalia]
MSGYSTSAIRGADPRTYLFSPYDGKQFDNDNNDAMLSWKSTSYTYPYSRPMPSNEKIYRKRMMLVKGGSRYDCRLTYPKDHVLAREMIKKRDESEVRRATPGAFAAEEVVEGKEKGKGEAGGNWSEWIVWIRDEVLRLVDDAFIFMENTRKQLPERLHAAEQAYEQARSEAGVKMADKPSLAVMILNRMFSSRWLTTVALVYIFTLLICGANAQETGTHRTSESSPSTPFPEPGFALLGRVFSPLHVSFAVLGSRALYTLSWPAGLVYRTYTVLHSAATMSTIHAYVFVSTHKWFRAVQTYLLFSVLFILFSYLGAYLLVFSFQNLPHILGHIGTVVLPREWMEVGMVEGGLLASWVGVKGWGMVVWLCCSAMQDCGWVLRNGHQSFRGFCEASEDWVGLSAWMYYGALMWNSSLMHRNCLTLAHMAGSKTFWAGCFVAVLALDLWFIGS